MNTDKQLLEYVLRTMASMSSAQPSKKGEPSFPNHSRAGQVIATTDALRAVCEEISHSMPEPMAKSDKTHD